MGSETTTLASMAADWNRRRSAVFFRRRPSEQFSRISYDCAAMIQLGIDNGNRDAEGMSIIVIDGGRYSEGAAARLANLAARALRPTPIVQPSEWRDQ